jgi:hypothetical protein
MYGGRGGHARLRGEDRVGMGMEQCAEKSVFSRCLWLEGRAWARKEYKMGAACKVERSGAKITFSSKKRCVAGAVVCGWFDSGLRGVDSGLMEVLGGMYWCVR